VELKFTIIFDNKNNNKADDKPFELYKFAGKTYFCAPLNLYFLNKNEALFSKISVAYLSIN
jgi:hypothetical protein